MPYYQNLSFQNSLSPLMEQLIILHSSVMMYLIIILIVVMVNLFYMIFNSFISLEENENHFMEMVWTLSPVIILFMIGIPSLNVLYMMELTKDLCVTVKSIGHQWYWSYELNSTSMKMNWMFDSYLTLLDESNKNMSRLMEVDNRLILPVSLNVMNLVSSEDVIHSWTVPSLGVKIDAIPGRLNMINLQSNLKTILYGQCSEICGVNHSFMPISVEFI